MPNPEPKTCFDKATLTNYLGERLSELEETSIQQHLDDCPNCQQQLERVAGDQTMWESLKRHVSLSSDISTESEVDTRRQTLIEFLAPTDDPRMLGRLGNYEICGFIGQGSTGIVLKAFEPSLNRYVAIKVLSPVYSSNGAARKRFEREGRAVASVVHPNIVPIHAVDQFRDLPYIVMQYVPGLSLLQRLDKDGPLGTDEVARVGLQVAKGLAAAHKVGIVHRDVKPANVILENTIERAMVSDFGLARVADDASMTRSGAIAGTPQYMSPEQARGESIDARSDLFSLGSLMYAACTARPPFRAETIVGVIHRVCSTDPRPIREINPKIEQWMCDFIDRLIAKEPANRFQTADEVSSLLAQELAYLQNPTQTMEPTREWALGSSTLRVVNPASVHRDGFHGVDEAKHGLASAERFSPSRFRLKPVLQTIAAIAGLALLTAAFIPGVGDKATSLFSPSNATTALTTGETQEDNARESSRSLLKRALRRQGLQVTQKDIELEIARSARALGFVNDDGSVNMEHWRKFVSQASSSKIETYIEDNVWPTAVLRKLISEKVTVTDEDLRTAFEADYGPRVKALAIVLNEQQQALKVWQMANANTTKEYFSKLAHQYSVDKASQKKQGEIPPIKRHGDHSKLEAEAFSLQANQLSKVVLVGEQWVILYCLGQTKPDDVKFEAVKDELEQRVREKKMRLAMVAEIERLKMESQSNLEPSTDAVSPTDSLVFKTLNLKFPNPKERGKLVIDIERGFVEVVGHDGKDVVIEILTPSRFKKSDKAAEAASELISVFAPRYDLSADNAKNSIKLDTYNQDYVLNLRIKVPRESDLSLDSYRDGHIEAKNVSGSIDAQSEHSDIRLLDISGTANAYSRNGNLTVKFREVADTAKLDFESYNGTIDLALPEGVAATVAISSGTGSYRTSFDIVSIDQQDGPQSILSKVKEDADEYQFGEINGGGVPLRIENENGGIQIRKAGS